MSSVRRNSLAAIACGKSHRTIMPTALRQRQRLWREKKSPIKRFGFAKQNAEETVEDGYPPALNDFDYSLDAIHGAPIWRRY